jgi:hypothetical protein
LSNTNESATIAILQNFLEVNKAFSSRAYPGNAFSLFPFYHFPFSKGKSDKGAIIT